MSLFYEHMLERYQFLIRDIPEVTEAVWRYDSLFYDVSNVTCNIY
jgi:regulatory factor X 1/2/3/regulatory factor X 4